jgi:hypothetical protein
VMEKIDELKDVFRTIQISLWTGFPYGKSGRAGWNLSEQNRINLVRKRLSVFDEEYKSEKER